MTVNHQVKPCIFETQITGGVWGYASLAMKKILWYLRLVLKPLLLKHVVAKIATKGRGNSQSSV